MIDCCYFVLGNLGLQFGCELLCGLVDCIDVVVELLSEADEGEEGFLLETVHPAIYLHVQVQGFFDVL